MSRPPDKIVRFGQEWTLTVLKVIKTFPNGTPRILERIPEQGTTHISGGESFVTAYIPSVNFEAADDV